MKVRRQSFEEDERSFIGGGQVLGAIKAARGPLTPNGQRMRTLSPKGKGHGGDGQAVEGGRTAVQWEPFLAPRLPSCGILL